MSARAFPPCEILYAPHAVTFLFENAIEHDNQGCVDQGLPAANITSQLHAAAFRLRVFNRKGGGKQIWH